MLPAASHTPRTLIKPRAPQAQSTARNPAEGAWQPGTVPFPGRARPAAVTPSGVAGRPVTPTRQCARPPNLSFGLHSSFCLNLHGFD